MTEGVDLPPKLQANPNRKRKLSNDSIIGGENANESELTYGCLVLLG